MKRPCDLTSGIYWRFFWAVVFVLDTTKVIHAGYLFFTGLSGAILIIRCFYKYFLRLDYRIDLTNQLRQPTT
jgi:hypothetical protein